MTSPFRDMDLIVKTFDDAINKMTQGRSNMNQSVIEVESISPHYFVKKDGKEVARFNDILRPDALTKAYELKEKLEGEK